MAAKSDPLLFEHPSVAKLWRHQRATLEFDLDHPRAFDLSDAGTGKTAAKLIGFSIRKKRGQAKRMLVVCPKTLMYSAWGDDCEKFTPELTMSFATAEQRLDAFKLNTDVVVINHDGVKAFFDKRKQIPAEWKRILQGFDTVVIDEFNAFKTPSSDRSKCMAKLRSFFQYRYELSGTPNPNTVMELFFPTLILDDGKRLGTSYYSLRSKVQNPEQVGPRPEHLKWTDKPGAGQAIKDILGDITIRHDFLDVMTHVPPNHRDIKQFTLSKRAAKVYADMERDAIVKLGDEVINSVHAAALRTKLLQIASGAVYNGGESGSYTVIDTSRYEMIGDLVEERLHSVVFFNWAHQKELLMKEFAKRKVSFAVIDGSVNDKLRPQIVRDYQEGAYQTILLHPKTGAHGLTLTRGDTTIFSSPIYEADYLVQGEKRIHRGTQDKVTNTLLVQAKGTVEEIVYGKLFGKEANMKTLLDDMKHRST